MKKLIFAIILLLLINTSFSELTWSGNVCGANPWHLGAVWGCEIFNNCGVHTTVADCGSDCTYCGEYLSPCSGADISGTCTCESGWEKCGTQTGCATYILADPNNCGGCGVDCGDAPCVNGVCQTEIDYTRIHIKCGPDFGDKLTEGYVQITSPNYADYESTVYGVTYCQDWQWGLNSFEKYGYGYCTSGYKDCNNDGGSGANAWDGCETDITTTTNCGGCGNNCYDNPCSGANYLGYTSTANINSICYMDCDAGNCIKYTLMGGNCDSAYGGNDCDPGFYQYVLVDPEVRPALTCQTDTDDEHWCCRSTQCGHNGVCYELNDEINTEGNFYVCAEEELPPGETGTPGVYWKSAPKILNLARMIQYNRNNTLTFEDFDETLYLTNTGLSYDCDNSDYVGCVYGQVHYSYQYCSKISTVFDGMFNLEIPNKVPVKVSEQSLYDPYGETENVVSLKGCGAGGDLEQCS
ncbi:MAG: hypothetical protein JW791_00995 [Nanoarchaeota archaeon]|nr:hypothetical protein [Nanoarchaeota archaeon]